MKLLITGAAGFVASSFIDYLQRFSYLNNISVLGIDNFSFGYRERLEGLLPLKNFSFLEADLDNLEYLTSNIDEEFDVIINCAAVAPLPQCEINHSRCIKENVANLASITSLAQHCSAKLIIHFSSGAIYENVDIYPTPEDVQLNPRLVYPTSKYMSEIYLKSFAASHEIPIIALRLFNLYGPRQDYFREQPPLIGYLLKSIILNEQPILYSDGNQQRDYIYIDDLAKLLIKLIDSQTTLKGFTPLNVGSGTSISVNSIISILEEVSGTSLNPIRQRSDTFWDKYPTLFNSSLPLKKSIVSKEVNKYSLACTKKLSNYIDVQSFTSMNDGLSACYHYAIDYLQKYS